MIGGGAGFIGSNVASHYLARGDEVTVFDNLARGGTATNLEWLRSLYPHLGFIQGDVRGDYDKLCRAVAKQQMVFHLAAQVAVTTSVASPREDFEINAFGTLNVLEAIRLHSDDPVLLFSSTNKVYGQMEDVAIVERDGHYSYADLEHGTDESTPLDFHSPYGCSKGSGDQYVRDYSRVYGLRSVVFRKSCIYGERQFGNEDQGWVAWFTIAALRQKPITIYGDGMQIRDVLYVSDLIRAYDSAMANIGTTSGQVYNIGGGPDNTLSLLELVAFLEGRLGRELEMAFGEWRPGDQKVYISDIRKAERDFGWRPQVGVEEGVERLWRWVRENVDP